jgi:hypothetical protein
MSSRETLDIRELERRFHVASVRSALEGLTKAEGANVRAPAGPCTKGGIHAETIG